MVKGAKRGERRSIGTEFKKGYEMSQEIRSKISKALTGRRLSEEHKRKVGLAGIGRVVTIETKKKISASQKGRPANHDKYRRGKDSPSWRGGKSLEIYPSEFNKRLREQIRKSYNYRCQQCFRHQDELFTQTGRPRRLEVHHIDYDKFNHDKDNLIALCYTCHAQTNFNRVNWTEYFKAKIKELRSEDDK